MTHPCFRIVFSNEFKLKQLVDSWHDLAQHVIVSFDETCMIVILSHLSIVRVNSTDTEYYFATPDKKRNRFWFHQEALSQVLIRPKQSGSIALEVWSLPDTSDQESEMLVLFEGSEQNDKKRQVVPIFPVPESLQIPNPQSVRIDPQKYSIVSIPACGMQYLAKELSSISPLVHATLTPHLLHLQCQGFFACGLATLYPFQILGTEPVQFNFNKQHGDYVIRSLVLSVLQGRCRVASSMCTTCEIGFSPDLPTIFAFKTKEGSCFLYLLKALDVLAQSKEGSKKKVSTKLSQVESEEK